MPDNLSCMKLRCVTNSIRIRLRKSDIQLLRSKLVLEDHLNFPSQTRLTYGIHLIPDDHRVNLKENQMIVYVNEKKAIAWMDSEVVSLDFKIELGNDESLSILIEKDFPCKHTGADFDDTYHELQPEEFKMYRKPE